MKTEMAKAHAPSGMAATQRGRGAFPDRTSSFTPFASFTLFTLFTLFTIQPAVAQQTGQVRLFVDPGHSFEFVLDGKYRMQQREVRLATGPHRFQFWAPARSIVDTTLMVLPDTTIDFRLILPRSVEYVAYQEDLARLKREQWLQRGLPTALAAGAGAYAVVHIIRYRDADRQLKADEELYRTSADPSELRRLKEDLIPQHKDDFRRARTRAYVGTGVFVGLAAGATYAIVKAARKPVPFFEDKEKLRFDGLVWTPGPGGGTWSGGLTLHLR